MADLTCPHCNAPALRRGRARRWGFGRRHHLTCQQCRKGAGYAEVGAIVSTFAFSFAVPALASLGVALGRVQIGAEQLLTVAGLSGIGAAFGLYQVYERRKFGASYPDVKI